MKAHPNPLTDSKEIQQLAQTLSQADCIAFDTEFIRENTFYPSVELIQIATRTESWLVDAQAFRGKNAVHLKPLLDIFENPKILKVLHAAQGDQECLYTSYKVVAKPSFDTAVGASLCGLGDGIGLGPLIKNVLGVTLKKGHSRTNWAARPLPKQLLEYAHADVQFLIEAADKLFEMLDKKKRREWALELSAKWENTKLYENDPEGLALKLAKGGRLDSKAYAALVELMRWREDRVRQLNLPRRWVADDQTIVDLANVRPKDIDHLSTFRGLNKGEVKNSGERILQAILKSKESKVELPKSQKTDHPADSELQVIELLKAYLNILADREGIAVKHLMTVSQLLPLIRAKVTDPKDLVTKGFLSEAAAQWVGDEVVALLQGQRALAIRDGGVAVISTKS